MLGALSGYSASMARILISLHDALVRRIDVAASDLAVSRSEFIARTLARSLDFEPAPGSRTTARAALSRIDRVFERNIEPPEELPDTFQEESDV